ncbi:hypothetical protein ABMY26_31425 [Azospirillum sp. HJ39]|uniref:hypothetical protein n=1 Tax=Azospirillum sp. HJ39 TaxID=3159496 RepID=UPI0035574D5C
MSIIDLKTRVVNTDVKVFALHSGNYKQFNSVFRTSGRIFLDIPGVTFERGQVSNDPQLKAKVARARRMTQWYRARERGPLPPQELAHYQNTRMGSSLSAAVGNVKRLYEEARVGDIILVPGDGLFSDVLMGEIIEDPPAGEDRIQLEVYQEDTIPYRRVSWKAFPLRANLSTDLSRSLSRPLAITNIEVPKLINEVLQFVYGNYIIGNSAKHYFSGESYQDQPYAPVHGLTLLSALISAVNADRLGDAQLVRDLDIYRMASHGLAGVDVVSFQTNFASPGGYRLWANSPTLVLVVAALVAATSGCFTYDEAMAASVVNSAAAADASCMIPIQDAYRGAMELLGADKFNELVCVNQDAQQNVGLTSGVDVVQNPNYVDVSTAAGTSTPAVERGTR